MRRVFGESSVVARNGRWVGLSGAGTALGRDASCRVCAFEEAKCNAQERKKEAKNLKFSRNTPNFVDLQIYCIEYPNTGGKNRLGPPKRNVERTARP